jgi:hypothetical protein
MLNTVLKSKSEKKKSSEPEDLNKKNLCSYCEEEVALYSSKCEGLFCNNILSDNYTMCNNCIESMFSCGLCNTDRCERCIRKETIQCYGCGDIRCEKSCSDDFTYYEKRDVYLCKECLPTYILHD